MMYYRSNTHIASMIQRASAASRQTGHLQAGLRKSRLRLCDRDNCKLNSELGKHWKCSKHGQHSIVATTTPPTLVQVFQGQSKLRRLPTRMPEQLRQNTFQTRTGFFQVPSHLWEAVNKLALQCKGLQDTHNTCTTVFTAPLSSGRPPLLVLRTTLARSNTDNRSSACKPVWSLVTHQVRQRPEAAGQINHCQLAKVPR
jgi:hypothetical protein